MKSVGTILILESCNITLYQSASFLTHSNVHSCHHLEYSTAKSMLTPYNSLAHSVMTSKGLRTSTISLFAKNLGLSAIIHGIWVLTSQTESSTIPSPLLPESYLVTFKCYV